VILEHGLGEELLKVRDEAFKIYNDFANVALQDKVR
tara:strand:- start:403 stop:510 length:108 start_codon:yes stop_codon:yes gene_type:complete